MKIRPDCSNKNPVIVIGAGPAGLTAAYNLARNRVPVIVFEQDDEVGGLAKTIEYKGYLFDIGGHRFFTKSKMVNALWRSVLGSDLLLRSRLSRILYKRRFFTYPLQPLNALRNLGLFEAIRVLLSYVRSKLFPRRPEISLADWISNRFGRRLFHLFFRTYTEKVWGIPCEKISAQWAAQRIRGLSLWTALLEMVLPGIKRNGKNIIKTLIHQFYYPRLGPSMMWRAFCRHIEDSGGTVRLKHRVTGIIREQGKTVAVEVEHNGKTYVQPAAHVISSMPLVFLIKTFLPPAPREVLAAVEQLKYRDFITVALIIDEPDLFPDNWLYIHDESVRVGRIQNYKNWSLDMVPDKQKTCLGLEYFCFEGGALWRMDDVEFIAFAKKELVSLGLVAEEKIIDGKVVRMTKAYPVYDEVFQDNIKTVRGFLGDLENLQEVGRNGLHRYNNMDHSMLTALLAVRNLFGEHHDLWAVNADDAYHEDEEDSDIETQIGL